MIYYPLTLGQVADTVLQQLIYGSRQHHMTSREGQQGTDADVNRATKPAETMCVCV